MEENQQAPTPDAGQAPPTPETTPTPPPTQPEPTPTPPMTQPLSPAAPVKVPGKNKNMLMIIVIAALIVLAGVAYAAYAYVTNTPDYLLSRATDQFGRNPNNAMAARFKVVNGTDSTGMSFSGDIAVHADTANKNGELLVGLGSGNSRVTLTARSIDSTTYLKAGSLANLPNLIKTFAPDSAAVYDSPEMKAALARIDEKWFSITQQDLQSLGASATLPAQATPADLQRFFDIYRKHKVFEADKSYADEKIDNLNTAHFTLKINKTELVNFLNEVKSANLQSFKVTDADIQDASKNADDFTKNAVVDVWITRDTKEFKQVRFASIEKGSEGAFTLTFVTQLPQFEKLDKPADAQPFSTLLTTFLGQPNLNMTPDSRLNPNDF